MIGLFLLCSHCGSRSGVGLRGQFMRHILLLFRPGVRCTGKREVMTRCLETGSGGIFPFRGRDATWIAGFHYTRMRPELETSVRMHSSNSIWRS
jgi:hypothetical protein